MEAPILLTTILLSVGLVLGAITDSYSPACSKYSDPPPSGWKRWSAASTWPGGVIPGISGGAKNATIPCDTGIILDTSVTLDQLVILGWLRVIDPGPFTVTANFVIVKGKLNIGTESTPYTGKIRFYLKNGGYTYNFDGNSVGMKAFAVIGGSVELNGMYRNQQAWSTLTQTATKGSTSIRVNGDVSAWPVGGTIAISSTDYDFRQAEERTISSITKGNGFTTIAFSSPLTYMHWGDPIYVGSSGQYVNESAEVTLLDRTIVIQGTPETDPLIGGHFIVFQTKTQQKIIGVELTNMGQQGTLGRYPMHFHLSQDVSGSYVKKCSVHHSSQRCYVIHGSWNLLLDGNSAYRTKGHCYFLEDGIEYGNVLSNNLGFYQEAPARVPSGSTAPQSDSSPSTFWISNPNNVWKNNVAGGSDDSGYWFELGGNVMGPSVNFPNAAGVHPHFLPLGVFEGNVGHSNLRTGLRTYSDGYRSRVLGGVNGNGGPINAPNQDVTFKNLRMYKNAFIGMFIHESDSIVIDGGFFADNRVVQLELHQVEHIIVKNAIVLGETRNVGNPTQCDQSTNGYAKCQPLVGCTLPVDPSKARTGGAGSTRRDSPIFGILLDQSTYPSHGLTILGHSKGAPFPQHIYNVTFGMFDNTCKVAAAITANGKGVNPIFSASHSSKQLKFPDASPRFYMTPRNLGLLGFEGQSDAGPTTASYVFRDEDGTLVGGPGGYVVTDTKAILGYGSTCKQMTSNYGWGCKNTCYRTVAFALSGISGTPTFTIKRTLDGVTSKIDGFSTTFLNLLSGATYEISISPQPSSVQVWYADPEGCKGTIVFRLSSPVGYAWQAGGASWLSCAGSSLDPTNSFQIYSACFDGVNPLMQVILGGKANGTLDLSLTAGTRSCVYLQCGLVGAGTKWLYNDNGDKLLSPGWSAASASTSGWKSGKAVLGYGGGETTTIRTSSSMNSVTWYFKQTFSFKPSSCLQQVLLGVIVNDGVVIYLNGKEIYRNNMPAGSVTAATTALSSKGDWRVPAFTTTTIDISQAGLLAGVNVIAAEVHMSSQFSWNARFDMYVSAAGSGCGANGIRKVFASKGLPLSAFPVIDLP